MGEAQCKRSVPLGSMPCSGPCHPGAWHVGARACPSQRAAYLVLLAAPLEAKWQASLVTWCVCLVTAWLSNGVDYGPVLQIAHGRPLPQIGDGCQIIPDGTVFLASQVPRSLDSRYYGAVRLNDCTAVAFSSCDVEVNL